MGVAAYLHWPGDLVPPLSSWSSAAQASAPGPNRPTAFRHHEIRVVDGDTIDTIVQPSREWRRFRLVGFDTPETYYARCDAERALGYEAARRRGELVRTGEVRLNVQEGARDRYSRGLATLRVDGVDVGRVLIREGLAVPYSGRGQRTDWCAKLVDR